MYLLGLHVQTRRAHEDLAWLARDELRGSRLELELERAEMILSEAGVGGTPTAYLNGVELNGSDLADLEGLSQKIDAATAQ